MVDHKASVREKTKEVLLRLTEEERRVLSAVLKIERDNLHLRKPHGVRDDLLKAVREIVKELPQ